MKDMLTLMKNYNALLERYKKGMDFIEKNPDKKEESQKTLDSIQKEMDKILAEMGDGNYSVEEVTNGFSIVEEVKEIEVAEQLPTVSRQSIIRPQVDNSIEAFNQTWSMAEKLAKSTIIPVNYQNKPENVIIALGMAQKMGLDAFTVMQNLNMIKGKTSWSGSFCKTLIEMTGRFKNLELNYVGEKGKPTYGCYLSATRISDGKVINGAEVTMKMATEEGWTSNKKWLTMPELMLAYRCQSFFARVHCPEAMNGIYTSEEMEDIGIKKVQKEYEDIL